MHFLIRLVVTAFAAIIASYFLDGVHMADFQKALWVAIALALLNTFIRPILVLITIPITVVTLGLFLLVINALMVKMADYLIDGFAVRGWLTALLFSLIVSAVSFIGEKLLPRRD
jgi:putative membrane protein